MTELLIDRLARQAETTPQAPLAGRFGLTLAEAWAQSGAVASWLIAQGYGPAGLTLAVPAADSAERAVLLLGALRAGAAVVDPPDGTALVFEPRPEGVVTSQGIALAALIRTSVDAAVAERRLHIGPDTPARIARGVCRRHGDFKTIDEVLDV